MYTSRHFSPHSGNVSLKEETFLRGSQSEEMCFMATMLGKDRMPIMVTMKHIFYETLKLNSIFETVSAVYFEGFCPSQMFRLEMGCKTLKCFTPWQGLLKCICIHVHIEIVMYIHPCT